MNGKLWKKLNFFSFTCLFQFVIAANIFEINYFCHSFQYFRVFLCLTFFAKSINKVTRGDYVSWGAIAKIIPTTEISPTDGKNDAQELFFPVVNWPNSELYGAFFCITG